MKFYSFCDSIERSKTMNTLPLFNRFGKIIVATIALLLLAILPATAAALNTTHGSVRTTLHSSGYYVGYPTTLGNYGQTYGTPTTYYYYYTPSTGTGTYTPPTTTPKPTPAPAPTPKPAPTPTTPPTSGGTSGLTSQEATMFGLVNQERAKAGLQSYKVDLKLVDVARKKVKDMIDHNYFGHTSPTYGSPFDMMKKAGISYFYAGENLAANTSVQAAHQALMNSSGHRANILNPNFNYIGIGILGSSTYPVMVAQEFVGR
jgi:uncharacterized YkwD family protein